MKLTFPEILVICTARLRKNYSTALAIMVMAISGLQGCAGVNAFPVIARAGDTVSVMVAGSELARKNTVSVTLQDATGQTWDLQALGLVRSVFNVRPAGQANGLHYSSSMDSDISWVLGHEPVQTVLVTDLPTNAAAGNAKLTISVNASDNSSGVADPFNVKLQIIPGTGSPNQFLWRDTLSNTSVPLDFGQLEPAPYAKISFASGVTIGAASLKIGFNNTVLNGNDINIYTPESTVRGSSGAFGANQRMVYWHQDGQNLYIDIVAPQGINGKYLQLFVVHPAGLSGSPNFTLSSATVYGTDGSVISSVPTLVYFP